MAGGLPGLRNLWDAVGWVADEAADALGDVANVALSPFMSSDNELFGLVSLDDLKSTYKKRKERANMAKYGRSSGLFNVPQVDKAGLSQDLKAAMVNQALGSFAPQGEEAYPLQNYQNVQGIDTSKYINGIKNVAESGKLNLDLNFQTVKKGPAGPTINLDSVNAGMKELARTTGNEIVVPPSELQTKPISQGFVDYYKPIIDSLNEEG